jgi:hypothetical protein
MDEGADDALASIEGFEVGVEDSSNVGAGVGPSCGSCSCGGCSCGDCSCGDCSSSDKVAISAVLGAEVGCVHVGRAVGIVVGIFVGRRVGDLCKIMYFIERFKLNNKTRGPLHVCIRIYIYICRPFCAKTYMVGTFVGRRVGDLCMFMFLSEQFMFLSEQFTVLQKRQKGTCMCTHRYIGRCKPFWVNTYTVGSLEGRRLGEYVGNLGWLNLYVGVSACMSEEGKRDVCK